jgi:hypothetical protein
MKHSVDWQDVAAPLVLLLTGLLLTSGACMQWLSFDRMQNLWPAAVLLAGLVKMVSFDGRKSS